MSRSFDQMNQDEWDLINEDKNLKYKGGHQTKSNFKQETSTPLKQNFPRTNPHVTMQRSSSSFRSNKDFLLAKDHNYHHKQQLHQQQQVMQNAQSMADCLHDTSLTLRKYSNHVKRKNNIDFFASSFNFRNDCKDDPVQLLSFKSGPHRDEPQAFDDGSSRVAQPSESTLMISSIMSASVKSCDTADEFTGIDQTSFCSAAAVARGADECDSNSVFSSASTPPPTRISSVPAWAHKVGSRRGGYIVGDDDDSKTLRKPQREKNSENELNVPSKREHGMCYSESDAQWEEDAPRLHFAISGGSHLSPFAQFVIKELSPSAFNDHRKRFLGKPVPIGCLLNWSKDGIRKPILRTSNRIVNREAADIFKRIQLYMGDRHFKRSQSSSSSSSASASLLRINNPKLYDGAGVAPSLSDQSVLAVVVKGWMLPELRDEIYVQLCKQTNGNPKLDGIRKGLELMCICLTFFPPARMTSSLKQRVSEAKSTFSNCNHAKLLCCLKQLPRRLELALASGAKRGVCKPTAQEFEVSRESIYTPPLFGSLLSEVMEVQREKFPDRKLPWVLTTLSEAVLRLNGMNMEGIFRIPGDIDEVNRLRAELSDKWSFPKEPLNFDASVPASLLKLWLRQLPEPLIPYEVYEDCLQAAGNPSLVVDIVTSRLPQINRLVLAYVIRFLQVFAASPVSSKTKMDANNLAMVMAPNVLRSRVVDPCLLLDQAKKEMSFVRLLILLWDTSFMENIV